MRKRSRQLLSLVAMMLVLSLNLTVAPPAEASIHEIIGALCRVGGEVMPPGQNNVNLNSFVRALQATGVITSIEMSATAVVINFDPTTPNSKFISAGFDLVLENEIAPGVDLVLSPLVIPDPRFPAHAACRNLNP